MLDIMNDENNTLMLRLTAAENLFWCKEYSGLQLIMECLKHEDLSVREQALGCIFQFKDKRIIPALRNMLEKETDSELKKRIRHYIQRRMIKARRIKK